MATKTPTLPQTFTTSSGEEFVIIERTEYERLKAGADTVALLGGDPSDDDEEAIAAYAARIRAENARSFGDARIPADILRRAETVQPIKVFREWRGLTQAQLAEASGTDQTNISMLEHGRRRGSATIIAAIARALNVPMELLVVDDLPGGPRRVKLD